MSSPYEDGAVRAHRRALMALAHTVEPGDERAGAWVNEIGPEEAVRLLIDVETSPAQGLQWEGLRTRLRASDYESAEAKAHAHNARIITRADADWPTQLRDLGATEPFALWVMGLGSLRLLSLRSLAMVGARASTAYGEHVARSWAADFASEGWTVTSGGALGIDAAAHRGALDAGGVTIAALACGIDLAYPRSHEALFTAIADCGLVVTELPPGESVRRQRFLARNRLVAALTKGTVVIEAAWRSGTTATARFAGSMNRPVLAVPGSVASPMSAGCHRMIRDHEALLVATSSDVLEHLRPIGDEAGDASPASGDVLPFADVREGLDTSSLRVLDAMPRRSLTTIDGLSAKTALDRMTVLSALGRLAGRGCVVADGPGWRMAR